MPEITYEMDCPSIRGTIEIVDDVYVYRPPARGVYMEESFPILDNLLKRVFPDRDPKRAITRRSILNNMGWEYAFKYEIRDRILVSTLFKMSRRQIKRTRGIGEKCVTQLYGYMHSDKGAAFKEEFGLNSKLIDMYSDVIFEKFRK